MSSKNPPHSPNRNYSISELAREFDITTRSIRFYEDKGLLHPTRRGQTRIYTGEDRVRLMLILRGKRLGFSLDESREIIDMYDPSHGNQEQLRLLLERIHNKRAQLQQQLQDIHGLLGELDEAEARARTAFSDNTDSKNTEN
jgi:DNA-binding transcriptional MerR regulator